MGEETNTIFWGQICLEFGTFFSINCSENIINNITRSVSATWQRCLRLVVLLCSKQYESRITPAVDVRVCYAGWVGWPMFSSSKPLDAEVFEVR